MALLSQPEMYQRYLEVARTSQGWADTQIDIQKNTISRQLEGLQADIQALVVTLDDAGASTGLSNFIKDIRSIVQVLQNVDPNKISSLMDLAKYLAAFKAGQLALSGMTTVFRAFLIYVARTPAALQNTINSFNTMNASATSAARAVGNVNKVMRLLGGIGSVVGVVLLAGEALYTFWEAYQKYSGKDDSVIAKFEEEADRLPQLISELQNYSEQLKNSSLTEAEAVVIKQNLSEAEKELADKIGQAGVDRLKAAGFTKEAINTEIRYYQALQLEKDKTLKKTYETQLNETQTVIESTKKRIEAIKNEIRAENELAQARMASARATYQSYIDRARKYHDAGNDEAANDLLNSFAAKAARADWEAAYDNLGEVIEANKERAATAEELGEQLSINEAKYAHYYEVLNPQSSVKDIAGKGEVEANVKENADGKSSSSGSGSSGKGDYTEKAKRNQLQREWNEILYNSSTNAKAYDNELKKINSDEQFYGKTVSSHNAKVDLHERRAEQLSKERQQLEEYQKTLEQMLDDEMSANEKVANAVGYKNDMTFEEKLKITEVNKELFQQIKSYSDIVTKINAVNQKLEENKGKAEDVANTIRSATEISQNPTEALNNGISAIGMWQATEKAKVNRPNNIYKDSQENQIDLEAENQKLRWYASERKRLQLEVRAAEQTGNQQLIYETKNALDEIERQYQETYANIQELEFNKNIQIKQGLADIADEFLIQGNSLRDIWNDLWTDLAREAIQRLFQVQAQSSFLGSLFGIFGGGSGGVISAGNAAANTFTIGGNLVKVHTGGNISGYPKMHSGGLVEQGRKGVVPKLRNDEVIRTLQVGEEVNSMADRRSNEILGAVAMKALDSENMRPNNVYITALDSRTFAEYLNDNADVLLGVLAKQGALGRRS